MENIKEINTDEIKSKLKDKKEKSEAWESGLKILKKMQVVIPLKLLLVCNQIADKIEDEFSIVTNIFEKDDIELTLSEEFYIPKQEVNSSYINYHPDEYKFNTVIHRHPDNCNSFSSTDQNYINQNFELSILYTKRDGFIAGQYNLKHENGYLIQLPVEIFVDYGIDEIDLGNIGKPAPLVVIDKSKKHKGREPKSRILDTEHEWDLRKFDTIPERKDKLLFEEKLDYAMMKDFLLEEINEQIQGMEYRLDNLEDMVFHQASFATNGSPF
jgi:hypothetical protein